MNPKVEASTLMTKAWQKMVQGPGIEFYLSMDDQAFRQFNDVLKRQMLPSNIAKIPGIVDIVIYMRALNDYLK